jgi:hypothetical protein
MHPTARVYVAMLASIALYTGSAYAQETADVADTESLEESTDAEDAEEEGEETKSIHYVRPEACRECHEVIYEQWKRSMHTKSTALQDPIHAAFY